MADIHQRVIGLEERAQAHDTGIGEVRRDIADLRVELRSDIATVRGEMAYRSDIADLRAEIAGVRGEIGDIRKELADVRSELSYIRGEMVHRSDLADLRNDMNQRFAAMDQKFTWLVGIQVAGLVAVVGALVGSYYR